MTKEFVIVIDAQYDFVMPKGALYVTGAENITVPGNEYLQQLNPETTAGVLFTFDTHDPETYPTMPESQQFPLHCVRGTNGWQLVFNELLVDRKIPTYALYKGVFNMWEEPGIIIEDYQGGDRIFMMDRENFFLNLKGQGVDKVTVIGVAADFCVKWAVDGLIERGFEVEVPKHLTRGIVRQINQVVDEDFADKNVRVG